MSKHSKTLQNNPAFAKAMTRVMITAGTVGMKVGEEDRRRREAIAATFDGWLETLGEAERRKVLIGLQLAASAANRRRIATHPLSDDTVAARVEAELAERAKTEGDLDDQAA